MADILTNPKARRDYHILETFEAGIVLHGTEVKALRAGRGQLSDAFARVENGEVYLYNAHIDEYSHGNLQNHQPKAPRKLLLHKSEIRKLFGLVSVKGTFHKIFKDVCLHFPRLKKRMREHALKLQLDFVPCRIDANRH